MGHAFEFRDGDRTVQVCQSGGSPSLARSNAFLVRVRECEEGWRVLDDAASASRALELAAQASAPQPAP